MGFKPVSELTPEQLEERRAYMREAKRRSRVNGHKEKPYSYKYRDRAEYFRKYRARKKAENK